MSYDVTDDVIQYRVCIYSNNINPTKFGEDKMKNGRVILFTSSRAEFTGNDVIMVIMTKINRVLLYPIRNKQSCEVSSKSGKIESSYGV